MNTLRFAVALALVCGIPPVQAQRRMNANDVTGALGYVPMGYVVSNTALKAMNGLNFGSVIRRGFAAPGDGGVATYVYSTVACTLNSGAGDDGAQIKPAAGAGCWNADFASAAADIRVWGAVGDYNGTSGTDNLAAISKAIASAGALGLRLTVPNLGFFNSGSLNFGAVPVEGSAPVSPSNPPAGPHLVCAASIAAPCAKIGVAAKLAGGSINRIWISYAGKPVSGDVGLQIIGFNSVFGDTLVTNAYDGYMFGDGNPAHAIGAHGTKVFSWRITHDHVVQNSQAEAYITNARFGVNGPGDVASNAYLGFTGTDPNTFNCTDCQFNQGIQVAYLMDFYNITSQSNGLYAIRDSLADMTAGIGPTAIIHSDGTGTCLRCSIQNSDILGGDTAPMFAMGTAGPMHEAQFTNSRFFIGDFNPPAVATRDFKISDDWIEHDLTLAGASGETMSVSNVTAGGTVALSGTWTALHLDAVAGLGGFSDTAHGNVFQTGGPILPWTPVLDFGGANTGMTYTSSGSENRNPDGTVTMRFGLHVTGLGSSTGSAVINGFAFKCAAWGYGAPAQSSLFATGMQSLTGAAAAFANQSASAISLVQAGATGTVTLTNSNFTASSMIAGVVTCPAN